MYPTMQLICWYLWGRQTFRKPLYQDSGQYFTRVCLTEPCTRVWSWKPVSASVCVACLCCMYFGLIEKSFGRQTIPPIRGPRWSVFVVWKKRRKSAVFTLRTMFDKKLFFLFFRSIYPRRHNSECHDTSWANFWRHIYLTEQQQGCHTGGFSVQRELPIYSTGKAHKIDGL